MRRRDDAIRRARTRAQLGFRDDDARERLHLVVSPRDPLVMNRADVATAVHGQDDELKLE